MAQMPTLATHLFTHSQPLLLSDHSDASHWLTAGEVDEEDEDEEGDTDEEDDDDLEDEEETLIVRR